MQGRGDRSAAHSVLFSFRTRGRNVLAGVVLLDFDEVFLGMGAYLNDVLCSHVSLNLLPGATVFLQSIQKEFVLLLGPVFTMLRNDVLLSRFLRWRWRG